MLTPAQEFHNKMLDFEIACAEREKKRIDEFNKELLDNWEVFLKNNPDHPFKSCPGLILTSPKRVIGYRYVE